MEHEGPGDLHNIRNLKMKESPKIIFKKENEPQHWKHIHREKPEIGKSKLQNSNKYTKN